MDKQPASIVERILVGAFGACFGGVGLALLCANLFSWGMIGSGPGFFRVVAIFMSLPFIAFGGAMLSVALSGKRPAALGQNLRNRASHLLDQAERAQRSKNSGERRGRFACPHCGAPLGENADISPSGDVKCDHCRAWFNVR